MAELFLAPLKRIVHAVKATGRKPAIGSTTLELFRDEVERYAEKLATESAVMAAHMGRTTIKPHDIEAAVHKIRMNPEHEKTPESTTDDVGYDIY